MSIKTFIKKEQFYHHFQPIYDLNNFHKLGFEGLFRSDLHSNPEYTFDEARKQKQLFQLDSRSLHKAILTYRSAKIPKRTGNLFLNIYPSTILNPMFPSFLNQIIADDHITNQQIVFEICESEQINDFEKFKSSILELKKLGFLFAIDDIGKGYANFKTIIELEPDYLKLDRYFAKDIYISKQKQSIIKLFINYSEEYNCKIILEGVESEREVAMAKLLGIPYAQGFGLGKPDLLSYYI